MNLAKIQTNFFIEFSPQLMLEGDGEQDQNKGGEDDELFSRKIPDTKKNRKIFEKKIFYKL